MTALGLAEHQRAQPGWLVPGVSFATDLVSSCWSPLARAVAGTHACQHSWGMSELPMRTPWLHRGPAVLGVCAKLLPSAEHWECSTKPSAG